MYTDLKLIWVISLLLLLIIVLSGIKVCNIKLPTYDRFIDRRYNYISEPFDNINIAKLTDSEDKYISKNLSKLSTEKKEQQKIKDLTKSIELLESKMKKLIQ